MSTRILPQFYRRRTPDLQAMQWLGGPELASHVIDWLASEGFAASWTEAHDAEPESIRGRFWNDTGRMLPGDWVIRSVAGTFGTCNATDFAAGYIGISRA